MEKVGKEKSSVSCQTLIGIRSTGINCTCLTRGILSEKKQKLTDGRERKIREKERKKIRDKERRRLMSERKDDTLRVPDRIIK